MVFSRVVEGVILSSSNSLMHVVEIVLVWTPVNLGNKFFNDQGYNQNGDLLIMDSTEIDEMKVSVVKSATKNSSMKVKKQIQNITNESHHSFQLEI